MSSAPPGLVAPHLSAGTRSRRHATTARGFLVVGGIVWGTAEFLRAVDFPERTTKGWCSLAVVVGALVQLTLMAVALRPATEPLRALRLRSAHRRLGTFTLSIAGFVTYLCFTGPFPGGATLHRLTGYVLCGTVLAKLTTVADRPHHRRLLATLGVVLLVGFVTAFVSEGWPALVGGR